ncbi:TniQ family protein [Xanthomonas sp. BRIP62409]|uniref:TniQ family protein n=1 Tax=Xanthomonas sp. BRIP62409 TaxID=2182388 RepID=UPI000F8C97AB|nr:TniQ family protein [Xanthomonas sp. BRIP62409]
MRLVVTPAPLATECVTGYLHTLCAHNGYPRPSFLLTGLISVGKNSFKQVTPALLQELSGLPLSVAKRLCFEGPKRSSRLMSRLVGQLIHTSQLRMDIFAICPACIAEGGRHEAAWHLDLVGWCPRHGLRLLQKCEICDRDLEWNRPTLGKCSCGADLTKQGHHGQVSPPALARLVQAIEASLYRRIDVRPYPAQMQHLAHLTPYALSRLIVVLSEQYTPTGSVLLEGRKRGRNVTADQLEKVAELLDDWPRGFQRFLALRYGKEALEDKDGAGFRQAFHWALNTLSTAEASAGPIEFGFLRDQLYRFGENYLSREQLVRGDRVRRPIATSWGALLDVALEANADPRALVKGMREDDALSVQTDYRRLNRNLIVDPRWLEKYKISQYAPIHERDAADTIGISASLLSAFRKGGIYESHFYARSIGGYSEEDVGRFAKILSDLTAQYSIDATPGGITLDGISLRTTKSLELRTELMVKLQIQHPDVWSRQRTTVDDHGEVEVWVYGHNPAIVGRASVENDPRLLVRYPSGDIVTAQSASDMAALLIEDGFKQHDVALARPGGDITSPDQHTSQAFLRVWDEEWKRLAALQERISSGFPDWFDARKVSRLLRLDDPRNITKLEAQGKLLGILLPVWGQRIYPTFQFDATTLKPQIAELLSYLPRDPNGWAQAIWLISSNKQLGGSAPIDMAEDLAALVQATSP